MEVMTAGTMTLPTNSEGALSNTRMILDAADKLGIEYPRGGAFWAGQVFLENSQPVEVRLAILPKEALENPNNDFQFWTTDAAPEIAYVNGQLRYNHDPQNRAHLSAAISFKPDGSELGIIFDLRDDARVVTPPIDAPTKAHRKLPTALPYPTFAEAKAGTLAISDGRDGRDWRPIQGTIAALHATENAAHQVRFEPNDLLVAWWGKPLTDQQTLWDELKEMDMDSVMLYQVTLANILFAPKARFTASLDELIRAIGREGEAKRSAASRTGWRSKVWRTLLLFDSLAVIGARSGTYREATSEGGKRAKMPAEKLVSRDPLFRIVGTRETEQGSFDKSEPPVEVSLVPGEWLMQFHGNREVLHDFGDVLKIAAIPRGKATGNWAACIGLMLTQSWRERAAKATRKRAGEVETLNFGTFTRRQLLAKTLRSDHDVDALINDKKGRGPRVRDYWKTAIQELKNADVIGHYAEGEEPKHEDWRERWLDQRLDIRPKTAMQDALKINASATKARARTTRRTKPQGRTSAE